MLHTQSRNKYPRGMISFFNYKTGIVVLLLCLLDRSFSFSFLVVVLAAPSFFLLFWVACGGTQGRIAPHAYAHKCAFFLHKVKLNAPGPINQTME